MGTTGVRPIQTIMMQGCNTCPPIAELYLMNTFLTASLKIIMDHPASMFTVKAQCVCRGMWKALPNAASQLELQTSCLTHIADLGISF